MNDLILSLFTAAYAWWCAMDDAEAIAAGKKIRHALQWCIRAAVVLGACWLYDAWLMALPLAFLFSGVFRLCLNRLRGLDVRYVSPSNWYDRGFLWICGAFVYTDSAEDHMDWLGVSTEYRHRVHRAGTIAYIFEAVAYVAGMLYL